LPSHFCPFVSNPFSWHLFIFKQKKKKTIEKKKNVEKGGSFPFNSRFSFSLLACTSALPLLPFCFKRFLLAFFSSQAKKKKKKKKGKKMWRMEGVSFKLSFYPFTFGSRFYLPKSAFLFQHFLLAFSSFQAKKKKTKTKKKKP
jgi:hypothetical protein